MRRCLTSCFVVVVLFVGPVFAQVKAKAQNVPEIPYESVPNFLKLPPGLYMGEAIGVSTNSKGHIFVYTRSANTRLFEFDQNGKYVREVGEGNYGFEFAHSVRVDPQDNIWAVDEGTNMVIKFNPEGRVTMVLGRRPEPVAGAFDSTLPAAPPEKYRFGRPTDVTWDADDNIYIGDGYFNSRIAKFDKHGNWIKQWGGPGEGGAHANENPGKFRNPHNVGIDRQGNLYVADRGNRRIQVFDTDGNFKKFIFLNAAYDKTRHPVLGDMPVARPDETAPWTICITNGPTQYLYATDAEPGRLYKLSVPDGKILGKFGISGHELGQFNWAHGLACPAEDVIYVADMNNWRVQKLVVKGKR